MDADAAATPCSRKPASHPLPPPPTPFAVRARSRVAADLGAGAGAAFSGPPDTPPRRSPVTVPFLWEDAPGKPKAAPRAAATTPSPVAANAGPVPEGGTGDRQESSHADQAARSVPLKLPPRLRQVPSFDTPLSPKTVLDGPYHGCTGGRRPPRWARSGSGVFRRTPSAGVGLFSRTWSKSSSAGPDAPWCSPASSSSSTSSSSSVSTCFGGDDHGREVCSEEDDASQRASVRITRFRRNRSLPSISITTTADLWASIRRSVKQITPWN